MRHGYSVNVQPSAIRSESLNWPVPICLILPAITRVVPKLTPLAAFGLTLVMILAAAFHVVRGEYYFVPINLMLGGVAAFIAYGRLFVKPLAPRHPCAWCCC
ncbi:MAG: DoxX family protein [Chloroflexi bacterium]|nr:DoxX family protein [Chloroflexota bacterium]